MKFLYTISLWTSLLSICECSSAREQHSLNNYTISGSTLPFGLSKRTTCSGTCAECYGSGSIECGDNEACFNPTIGESCCAQYSYSCQNGYYCAPGGLDMQCCDNSISTDQCTASIENGGSSGNTSNSPSSGLSVGAEAGIGIGVALLVGIVVGLAVFFILRSRRRKRAAAALAPASWQMPELSTGTVYANNVNYGGGENTYGSGGNNYAGGSSYAGVDVKSSYAGGGGPPLAEIYTPGMGPQKAGYNAFVPSGVELPETPPVYGVSPAVPYSYPMPTEHDHVRAAEMYGGYTAHELNE